MAKIINGTRVVTNKVRLSYAHVTEKASINNGPERYSCSIIIDGDDKETLDYINQAIDNAINVGIGKFDGKKPNKAAIKLPLRDGAEKDDENYEGKFFVNANSNQKPQIIGPDKMPITDPTEIYSGCYAKVSLSFYAFNHSGNKGIACGLGNIMKVEDGEPLGSFTSADEDFSDEEGANELLD